MIKGKKKVIKIGDIQIENYLIKVFRASINFIVTKTEPEDMIQIVDKDKQIQK